MAKSATLYKDSPTVERGEDGSPAVKRGNRSDLPKEEQVADGTEGLPVHIRHAHERGEMHARHIHERSAMHHRHQTELAHHEGDLGEVHKRHQAAHKEMNERHHAELVALHKRHHAEHGKGEKE